MQVILHTPVTQPLRSSPFGKYVYHQYGFIIHQLINMHTKRENPQLNSRTIIVATTSCHSSLQSLQQREERQREERDER